MDTRVPQWEWYLRDPSDLSRVQSFISVLESAVKDAQKDEPRLQTIKSFSDLHIGYALNPSIGDEWVPFKKEFILPN